MPTVPRGLLVLELLDSGRGSRLFSMQPHPPDNEHSNAGNRDDNSDSVQIKDPSLCRMNSSQRRALRWMGNANYSAPLTGQRILVVFGLMIPRGEHLSIWKRKRRCILPVCRRLIATLGCLGGSARLRRVPRRTDARTVYEFLRASLKYRGMCETRRTRQNGTLEEIITTTPPRASTCTYR